MWFELLWTFFKVGICTFGGGYAMLPVIQREIVERKHWATDEEVLDYYAIGQCTPGIIALNTSTFVGYKQKGIPGAIACSLGFVLPSWIIITIIAAVLQNYADNIIVKNAFAGIRVCVCVLILNSVCKLWNKSIINKVSLIIFCGVFICSVGLKYLLHYSISPVIFVIIAGLVGIFLSILRGQKK